MSMQAAQALKNVQDELKPFGLGLKVFDTYRPQQSVAHFVRWAKDLEDTRMKAQYYPDVDKRDLFRDGYIASRSSHTRGSTVDLTLVSRTLKPFEELDMGSEWDYFDTVSWPENLSLNAQQRANRLLLRTLMLKHNFRALDTEWWHFTFNDEPFPDTYFNFPVQ
jgi:D-alanyl-D-alanine dipeptidase